MSIFFRTLYLVLFFTLCLNAQLNKDNSNWDDQFGIVGVSGKVRALKAHETDIYIAGDFKYAGNVVANGIAKWDGNSWSNLGTGIDQYSRINTMEIVGEYLYVGGKFKEINGIKANNIAKYNMTTKKWSAVGTKNIKGVNKTVNALSATDDGNLYIGGEFFAIGEQENVDANFIVMWDGEGWYTLGKGLSYFVYTIGIQGKSVYVGGRFDRYIVKWEIEKNLWSAVGNSFSKYSEAVYTIRILDDKSIYVGGRFQVRSMGTFIDDSAIWNGKSWLPAKEGMGNQAPLGGQEYEKTLDGKVYFTGEFEKVAEKTMNNITMWDSGTYHSLNGGKVNGLVRNLSYGKVQDLIVINKTIYAVGAFDFSSGNKLKNFAVWKENKWGSFQNGIDEGLNVLATDYKENLYIGGSFDKIDDIKMNGIAKWNGEKWQAFGIGENSGVNGIVYAIAVNSMGSVYVAGRFNSAGGTPTNNIAKWKQKKEGGFL